MWRNVTFVLECSSVCTMYHSDSAKSMMLRTLLESSNIAWHFESLGLIITYILESTCISLSERNTDIRYMSVRLKRESTCTMYMYNVHCTRTHMSHDTWHMTHDMRHDVCWLSWKKNMISSLISISLIYLILVDKLSYHSLSPSLEKKKACVDKQHTRRSRDLYLTPPHIIPACSSIK